MRTRMYVRPNLAVTMYIGTYNSRQWISTTTVTTTIELLPTTSKSYNSIIKVHSRVHRFSLSDKFYLIEFVWDLLALGGETFLFHPWWESFPKFGEEIHHLCKASGCIPRAGLAVPNFAPLWFCWDAAGDPHRDRCPRLMSIWYLVFIVADVHHKTDVSSKRTNFALIALSDLLFVETICCWIESADVLI